MRKPTQWYFQRYVPHLPSARRNHDVRQVVVQTGQAFEKVMEVPAHRRTRFCFPAPRFLASEQSLVQQVEFLLFKLLVCRVKKARQKLAFPKDRPRVPQAVEVSPIDEVERGEVMGAVHRARNEMLSPPNTLGRLGTIVNLRTRRNGPVLAPSAAFSTPLTTSSKTTTPSVEPDPRVDADSPFTVQIDN